MGTTRARAIAIGTALLLLIAGWPGPGTASPRSQQLYAQALVLYHAQRWEDAYLLLEEATRADPEDALAAYYRGLTGARLGFVQESIVDIEHALQLRPDLTGAVLDLGILYFEAGQYVPAGQWLQRAYQQPANHFAAALFLGLSYYRGGDDAEAHEYLVEAAKDPNLRPAANYYDALALLRLGKTEEARQLLAAVEAERPESEAALVAQAYLSAPVGKPVQTQAQRIEEVPWSVYGRVGFAYDSNVVLAPDSSAAKSKLERDGFISHESDGAAQIGFGGRYQLLDNDRVQGTVSYDFYQSVHFQITDFDLQSHRVRMDLTTPARGMLQVGVAGIYDFYMLDYQSFYQAGQGIPWLTIFEGGVSATQIYYSFRSRDFFRSPFSPFRDAYTNAGGVRQYFLLGAADRVLNIGYEFSDNDPLSRDGTDFAWQAHQFDFMLEFGLFEQLSGTLGYLFRLQDYEHPNSRPTPVPFTRRRHDQEHQVVVQFEYPLTSRLTASIAYLGVINESNISQFEYNRSIGQAGVTFEF